MPIDTSIYGNLLQRKSVGDFTAELQAQDLREQGRQQNALMLQQGRQKQDEYGRSVRDQDTIRSALGQLPPGATDDQRINALRGTGLPQGYTQADALQTTLTNRDKGAADIAAKRAEVASKNGALFKQYSGILMQSPTQQTAQALLAHYEQQTGENVDNIRAIIQQAGDNPQALQKIGAALSVEAEKLLPKLGTVNAGNAQVTQATDAVTGIPTQTGSVPIMQSPDSRAAQNTAGARLAFDREKEAKPSFDSASGSWVDPRTKTVTPAVGPDGKPLAGKAGAATEGERNAAGYASRMTEATKLLDMYEEKGRTTTKLEMAGSLPLVGSAARMGYSTPVQQQYRQAQEDWVRAKLRKESGASIATDEMDREIEAYFPRPGESPESVAQKRRARAVATEGMVLAAGRAQYNSNVPMPEPTAPKGGKAPTAAPKFLGFE